MPEIPHADYRVTIPDAWRDASVVMFAGPGNDGFGPTVTVGREPLSDEQTAEQYGAKMLPLLRETFAEHGFELVEEGMVTLNGIPAFRRRFNCALNAQTVTQVQYYLVREKVAYAITLSDRSVRFRQSFEAMRSIAESFQLA